MPRLSIYKPERGQDYKFIDRQISEMFQIGATEVYLHKYIGTNDGVTVKDHTQIQDLLFLENRDRKYDPSIYKIRGHYNVQNIDFNLSQFGLFIDNDTVFMVVHINDFIKFVGRKPMSGDVLELPHLRDEFAFSDVDIAMPRYYVIEDVGRASEGFSLTWYPHLYRLRLKKITDSQQFADILSKPADADNPTGPTLKDLLSTNARENAINDALIAEAEANAAKSGYDTRQFYTLAVDPTTGKPVLETADIDDTDPSINTLMDASSMSLTASQTESRPQRSGYTGYLLGDGLAPNGVDFGHGIQFPVSAIDGDYFLRTDFLPSRLFRFNGSVWVKVEDNVRMTMTNNSSRQTQKTGFINNKNITGSNEVAFDIITVTLNPITTVQTTYTYAIGMVATVLISDVSVTCSVTNGVGNKALITFDQTAQVGDVVQWKLFTSSVPERQSLSKALRPKADL